MAWAAEDARRHTGLADTPARSVLWAKIANRAKSAGYGDGFAIALANRSLYYVRVRRVQLRASKLERLTSDAMQGRLF